MIGYITVEYGQTDKWEDLTTEQQDRLVDRAVKDRQYDDYDPGEDAYGSLEAFLEIIKVRVSLFEVAPFTQGTVLSLDDDLPMTGKRAWAWLENVVLGPSRIPWTGQERWRYTDWGTYWKPGMVKPCPFSGTYFDEVIIDRLKEYISLGFTVKDAIESLADLTRKVVEDAQMNYTSEESVREVIEDTGPWEWPVDKPLAVIEI